MLKLNRTMHKLSNSYKMLVIILLWKLSVREYIHCVHLNRRIWVPWPQRRLSAWFHEFVGGFRLADPMIASLSFSIHLLQFFLDDVPEKIKILKNWNNYYVTFLEQENKPANIIMGTKNDARRHNSRSWFVSHQTSLNWLN